MVDWQKPHERFRRGHRVWLKLGRAAISFFPDVGNLVGPGIKRLSKTREPLPKK